VKGLTTGATIWVAGALGVACGGGWYVPAAITLVLALAVAHLLLGVEWMIRRVAGPAPDAPTGRRAER
jgi:putative Mg2+ transporter-C (MgtC) family protein